MKVSDRSSSMSSFNQFSERGASAFVEYVGLDSPLDVMINELLERY